MTRPFVALLACLSTAALAPAFADPPAATSATTPAATSTTDAAAASTTNTAATTTATAAKPATDPDVEHFVAEGYKPEMRGGHEVYCRKETALGSRVNAVKTCGTIQELRVREQRTQKDVQQSQSH